MKSCGIVFLSEMVFNIFKDERVWLEVYKLTEQLFFNSHLSISKHQFLFIIFFILQICYQIEIRLPAAYYSGFAEAILFIIPSKISP